MVSGLVGGPVEAPPNRLHEGLSETDILLQRLYALNIIAQAGYQPALELWQVRLRGSFPPPRQTAGLFPQASSAVPSDCSSVCRPRLCQTSEVTTCVCRCCRSLEVP